MFEYTCIHNKYAHRFYSILWLGKSSTVLPATDTMKLNSCLHGAPYVISTIIANINGCTYASGLFTRLHLFNSLWLLLSVSSPHDVHTFSIGDRCDRRQDNMKSHCWNWSRMRPGIVLLKWSQTAGKRCQPDGSICRCKSPKHTLKLMTLSHSTGHPCDYWCTPRPS